MHSLFISQILCQCQCDLWRDKPLYYRVICQIDKHGYMFGNTAFLKGTAKEISHIMLYAHSAKNDGKLFIRIIT